MDKKTIIEQYYIVSLDNGIREEEPINIEVFNTFSDGSELVRLNNTVFGVLKRNDGTPENLYIDDYKIIKTDIAELFDINHEETKRIVSEDRNIGTFTTLNYSKDIETRISATTVMNHMINYLNKGILSDEEREWFSTYLSMGNNQTTTITNHLEINNIIKFGLYSLEKEIELQTGKRLDEKYSIAIKKNYLRMIIFDFIVGRQNRGLDYYLISKMNENGKPIWLDSYLSPISIEGNKNIAINDKNIYIINNIKVDRQAIIDVLYENYYHEIKKLTEALNDAKKLYNDAIARIIYNNTDIDRAKELENLITANLNYINKKQEAAEKALSKEQKINKVEKTMATQSLNVRVTTKLDLIQKKYPINPKDHPNLLESQKEKDKKGINLIVEEEKRANGGFISSAILVSLIALICGMGIGIAYILMNFGS